jgi:hypothetical protein
LKQLEAGLIRSAVHTPYVEPLGYARTRVYRRAAISGPPNKTLASVVTAPAQEPSVLFADSCRRSAHHYTPSCATIIREI